MTPTPWVVRLVLVWSRALLNTSAHAEGESASEGAARDAHDVDALFGKQVDLIIDGGEIEPAPSTVVSLVADAPEVLREGKGDCGWF